MHGLCINSRLTHLIEATILLEYNLKYASPNNPIKLILIHCYKQLGAAKHTIVVDTTLDIKQIQFDSLNYIILPALIHTGYYNKECFDSLKVEAKILSSLNHENITKIHGTSKFNTFDFGSNEIDQKTVFYSFRKAFTTLDKKIENWRLQVETTNNTENSNRFR